MDKLHGFRNSDIVSLLQLLWSQSIIYMMSMVKLTSWQNLLEKRL